MNNGKVIATNGTDRTRVKLYHWWPGRQWEGPSPIPPRLTHSAENRGCRYLTLASVDEQGRDLPFSCGLAMCCPADTPDRKLGRKIALGRLNAEIEMYGWTLEA